jgi:hypothetical protein
VWEIFCKADLHSNDLHLGFADDVYACIDICDLWNTNASNVPCKGIALDAGTYGPIGEIGGSTCWLKFDASEAPDFGYTPSENTIVVHSAMLVSSAPVRS